MHEQPHRLLVIRRQKRTLHERTTHPLDLLTVTWTSRRSNDGVVDSTRPQISALLGARSAGQTRALADTYEPNVTKNNLHQRSV